MSSHTALINCFDMMLRFYGFVRDDVGIEAAPNYSERTQNWLNLGNHNHLRISRILKSMCLLGLEKEASQFFQILEKIYLQHKTVIGSSYIHWKKATEK